MKTMGYIVLLCAAIGTTACDQNDGETDATTDTGVDATPDATPDVTPEVTPDPEPDPEPDPVEDSEPDGTALCAPSWHPTSCSDCGGGGSSTGCWQDCSATSCADGSSYRAECDTATNTCHCFIDGTEVCTCTPTNSPGDSMGCQPEEWGGANCCWNVG